MTLSGLPRLARALVFGAVVLLGLSAAPIAMLAVFVGGAPDQITTAPLVEQWPLLKVLWASNPGAAIHIMLQQPLLVIAHSGPDGGVPAWRLFLYPVALAVQLAVSIFAAVTLISAGPGAAHRRLIPLLSGMAALAFVTSYVQVAVCCTGGPRWALDIWLFSLAYDPLSTLIDWQQLYLRIEGSLSIIQAALALLGTVLLASHGGRTS